MADEERAAKAARAKAMLKKRQQKKAGPSVVDAGQSTPGSPISRAMSPALPQLHDFNKAGAHEASVAFSPPSTVFADQLFGNVNSGEFASAPNPLNGATQNIDFDKVLSQEQTFEKDYSQLVQDQRQTISLLVSEKNSLTETVERYNDIEAQWGLKERELGNCKRSLEDLNTQLAHLNEEHITSQRQSQERDAENTSLKSRLRDRDRELQLLRTESKELIERLERQERRSRELEEQIQNDDRVERMEAKLQNTTERAEELEFQLSKARQSHSKIKEERSKLESTVREKVAELQEWQDKYNALALSSGKIQDTLTALTSERDALLSSENVLKQELQSARLTNRNITTELERVSAEALNTIRQVESAQDELRRALKRAEDAETIQRDLQEEGTSLMRSLEEMRPKIVELTGLKLDLSEQVERLSTELSERSTKIDQLENILDELQQGHSDDIRKHQDREDGWEREKKASAQAHEELQRAYSDLQTQLQEAMTNAIELDSDRSKQRHLIVRQQEELEMLRSSHQSQTDEIAELQSHFDERNRAFDDERRLREESQAEVEVLRAEISAKEDEMNRLRQTQTPSSRASPSLATSSFEDEVMNSLKQRHELELSAAKSQIRTLETSVFDAESSCRTMQKQINALKDELQHLHASSGHRRSTSMTKMYRARRVGQVDDMHRSSLSTGHVSPPVFYSPIDDELPPAIRHQRQISLGMLQARMYSESEAMLQSTRSEGDIQYGNGASVSNETQFVSPDYLRRSQFVDENHVFWCASCKGDLIVL